MWSDPVERALLNMRSALEQIQRGHNVYFGELDKMLAEALKVRETERALNRIVQPHD